MRSKNSCHVACLSKLLEERHTMSLSGTVLIDTIHSALLALYPLRNCTYAHSQNA
jgi:hypothetical protein